MNSHINNNINNNVDDRIPLLFVDVNLGAGKSERIVIFEGDKSEDLANKFAEIHGIFILIKI